MYFKLLSIDLSARYCSTIIKFKDGTSITVQTSCVRDTNYPLLKNRFLVKYNGSWHRAISLNSFTYIY